MYKLLAIDLDGTLLKSDGTISKANVEAIGEARKKGIRVVLATGRPLNGIKRYLKELNLIGDEYVIVFNGAVTEKIKNFEVIREEGVSLKDLEEIYALSKKLHVDIHVHTTQQCITPKINKFSEFEAGLNSIQLTEMKFEELPKDTEVIKMMLVGEKEKIDTISKLVDEYYLNKYTVVRSLEYYLEFLNKNANKGEALRQLAKMLNIDKEEIISIGDNENDINMIKFAGMGVAMANAEENVKANADYITSSNNEDGVAKVIKKFIFQEDNTFIYKEGERKNA